MFEIIPAIDLKNGKCVRLRQGRDEDTTEYSADPVAVARDWVRQGARRLHIVNLDGAFGRASANREVLQSIASHTDAVIEYGGGLRSLDEMEKALISGADKLVLGTVALEDPDLLQEALDFYGEDRIIAALDARAGLVATRGWTSESGKSVLDAAIHLRDAGVREILYTDISRDGMLTGPDIATLKVLSEVGPDILASGGIASLEDLSALVALKSPAIIGAIVGKALYEGRMTVASAIAHIRVSSI
jgi:phosphoribosylformimino-5-aminoimidazole carboxamide ribotide isomerase